MNSRLHNLFLLLSLLLAACIPKESPPSVVEKVPFKVLVHFSSDLSNPYYVLSGPFQSYQSFAVNESFQLRLTSYAAAKSDPLATQTLELTVHLTSLQTSFDRLGDRPEDRRPVLLIAGLGWSGDWPLSTFDSRDLDRFDDLPERITKTATLLAEVSIILPGHSAFRESIVSRSLQVLERWDMGLGTYDYHPLIVEVQTSAMREIERVLHRTLRRETTARHSS